MAADVFEAHKMENSAYNIICAFHCTKKGAFFWRGKGNFEITRVGSKRPGKAQFWIIEIKAAFRPLPKRILKRIKQRVEPDFIKKLSEVNSSYLSKTTSQKLSKEAGLNFREIGKEIAKTIDLMMQKRKKRPVERRKIRERKLKKRKKLRRKI